MYLPKDFWGRIKINKKNKLKSILILFMKELSKTFIYSSSKYTVYK